MNVQRVNPAELAPPRGFAHAVVATGTTVFLAGQTALDPDGRIVEKLRVDTPVDTGALADAVIDMSHHFAASYEIAAVGVAAPR